MRRIKSWRRFEILEQKRLKAADLAACSDAHGPAFVEATDAAPTFAASEDHGNLKQPRMLFASSNEEESNEESDDQEDESDSESDDSNDDDSDDSELDDSDDSDEDESDDDESDEDESDEGDDDPSDENDTDEDDSDEEEDESDEDDSDEGDDDPSDENDTDENDSDSDDDEDESDDQDESDDDESDEDDSDEGDDDPSDENDTDENDSEDDDDDDNDSDESENQEVSAPITLSSETGGDAQIAPDAQRPHTSAAMSLGSSEIEPAVPGRVTSVLRNSAANGTSTVADLNLLDAVYAASHTPRDEAALVECESTEESEATDAVFTSIVSNPLTWVV
jgi:hypothetical protein